MPLLLNIAAAFPRRKNSIAHSLPQWCYNTIFWGEYKFFSGIFPAFFRFFLIGSCLIFLVMYITK